MEENKKEHLRFCIFMAVWYSGWLSSCNSQWKKQNTIFLNALQQHSVVLLHYRRTLGWMYGKRDGWILFRRCWHSHWVYISSISQDQISQRPKIMCKCRWVCMLVVWNSNKWILNNLVFWAEQQVLESVETMVAKVAFTLRCLVNNNLELRKWL